MTNDNLEVACNIVEKAATDRAIREIDERLAKHHKERVAERGAGQPFFGATQGRFPASLPELLRPRPGQLNPQQARVYEDFARIPRTAVPSPPPSATGPVLPGGAPQQARAFGAPPLEGAPAEARPVSMLEETQVGSEHMMCFLVSCKVGLS